MIFALLGSPFIAALQVIVYAGAIMVLFLFVLMLLNVRREEDAPEQRRPHAARRRARRWSRCSCCRPAPCSLRFEPGPGRRLRRLDPERWPAILFSPHFLYVFEATSILILAALVGAVALAKKEL